jgi:hypothetical protein
MVRFFSLCTLAALFFVSLIATPAVAGTEPSPFKVALMTLTPEDGLRVNVACLGRAESDSVEGIILIRSLVDGSLLKKQEFSLAPGKGISVDSSWEELARQVSASDAIIGKDLPLRIQVKAKNPLRIFIGYEIHDVEFTPTRTYIPGEAQLLN